MKPPSNRPFVLAGAAGAIGVVIIVVSLVLTIGGAASALTRVDVPGNTSVRLEPGGYAVYHEYATVIDGTPVEVSPITGLACTMTDPTGTRVPLRKIDASMTYTFDGRSGIGLWSVDVAKPGLYMLACTYPGKTAASIGPGFGSSFGRAFVGIGLGVGGALFFFFAAIGLVVWGVVRRLTWKPGGS